MNIGIQIYLQHIDFNSSDCIDGNGVIKFYELKSPPPEKRITPTLKIQQDSLTH